MGEPFLLITENIFSNTVPIVAVKFCDKNKYWNTYLCSLDKAKLFFREELFHRFSI